MVVEDNDNGVRAATESGAHVLKVDTVSDVNYCNIRNFINIIEGKS